LPFSCRSGIALIQSTHSFFRLGLIPARADRAMTIMDIKRGRASLEVGLLRTSSSLVHYRFATTQLLGLIPHPKQSEDFLVP
jgi:hypothetical protein